MKPYNHLHSENIPKYLDLQLNGISIILPAYNVASKISKTLIEVEQNINQITKNYEIIVVNDGSKDKTEQVVKSYLKLSNKVKLISYSGNIGKGFAIKKGLEEATKESVIFMDSDSDIDKTHIEKFGRALKRNDVIIASKRHPHSRYEGPLIRKILSYCFNVLVKLLIGIRYSDSQVGLKGFRKEPMEKIMKMGLVKRHAFDVELLALVNLLKLRVIEVPVNIFQSEGFSPRSILYMLIDLMGIFYRLRIIRWYQKNL